LISADFFRHEYHINYALAHSPIPQIALWDGLVFGGGVGVSLYGKYRVATEHSLWAMPETMIGFFPDVGALYQMPKIMPSMGMVSYLALTGHRLTAPDLMYSGLATHYVNSDDLESLTEALELTLAPQNSQRISSVETAIEEVLDSFSRPPRECPPEESFLAKHNQVLHQTFDNVGLPLEDVLASLRQLENDNADFGSKTLETLEQMSPTSLKITWELLRLGRSIPGLEQHLALEYRLSQHLMKPGSDFHEGIRATLLDSKKKNKKPAQWNPPKLSQVSNQHIEQYYFAQPITEEWMAFPSPIFTNYEESRL